MLLLLLLLLVGGGGGGNFSLFSPVFGESVFWMVVVVVIFGESVDVLIDTLVFGTLEDSGDGDSGEVPGVVPATGGGGNFSLFI